MSRFKGLTGLETTLDSPYPPVDAAVKATPLMTSSNAANAVTALGPALMSTLCAEVKSPLAAAKSVAAAKASDDAAPIAVAASGPPKPRALLVPQRHPRTPMFAPPAEALLRPKTSGSHFRLPRGIVLNVTPKPFAFLNTLDGTDAPLAFIVLRDHITPVPNRQSRPQHA